MRNNYKETIGTLTIVSVIVISIVLRCVFDKNYSLIYITTSINIIAFLFVTYSFLVKLYTDFKLHINESSALIYIKEREIRHIKYRMVIIGVILFGLCVLYFFWCESLYNDIISIVSLGLSVLDDKLIEVISEIHKR